MPCTAALTLARTYSLIKIVGTGKRSVAVHYPIFDDCNSLKQSSQTPPKPAAAECAVKSERKWNFLITFLNIGAVG